MALACSVAARMGYRSIALRGFGGRCDFFQPHDPADVALFVEDLARVRREIQAVLTVIPLLLDDPPTFDVVHEVLLASSRAPVNLPDNDMAQLEIYYPFVRHSGMSERAIPRVLSGDDLYRPPGRSEPGERKS
jgi:hypothetical protein